jgi:hypothetical protein
MTPVEWNDSEPGYPDFLPPKPVTLSRADAEDRIERVLAAAGIDVDIWALEGGSVDFTATFPDGAVYEGRDIINIVALGYSHR